MAKKTVCFKDKVPVPTNVPKLVAHRPENTKARKPVNCGQKNALQIVLDFIRESMFIYETPKVVLIKSAKIGSLFRAFQIGILIYFISWVMIREKGYQKFDSAISGVTTKITGVAWTDIRNPNVQLAAGPRIWDNADYSVTPQQNSGFFIVTKINTLVEQTLGNCAETSLLPDARCETDADCEVGYSAGEGDPDENIPDEEIDVDLTGHGVFTGKCLERSKTCEIFAWCPIYDEADMKNSTEFSKDSSDEVQSTLDPHIEFFKDTNFIHSRQQLKKKYNPHDDSIDPFYDAVNFTIYIKNSIEFPYFQVKRRNILNWMNETYLTNCNFEAGHPRNQYCPRFRLGYIIEKSGANVHRLLKFGGVIAITIDWECNLDLSIDWCLPRYDFKQLDAPPQNKSQTNESVPVRPGEGWTVEYAYHYGFNGDGSGGQRRMLAVVNGIQFIVRSTGKAGKFNIINFTMNCGSGMALFGTATLLCDLILLNLVRDRHRYRKAVCDSRSAETKSPRHNKSKEASGNSNISSDPHTERNINESDLVQINISDEHYEPTRDTQNAHTSSSSSYPVNLTTSPDIEIPPYRDAILLVDKRKRTRLKADGKNVPRPESTISNKFLEPPILTTVVPSPRFI